MYKLPTVPTFRSFDEAPAILTLEETAKLLRLTYDGAKSRVSRGELPGAFKLGKRWLVDKEVLIQSLGSRRNTKGA